MDKLGHGRHMNRLSRTAPIPSVPLDADAARGFALMAAAMLLMPAIDAMAKILAESISPVQVTWGRFFFQTLLTAPLVIALHGVGGLWPNRVFGNLLRGLLIALASLLFFTAVKFMPLADTIAIFFVEPMILTLLSAILLKEPVGWRRRVAVLVGFCGALLVIRPSFSEVGLVALLPMGAALAFAFYLIVTRRIARYDTPATMQFVAGLAGTLFLSGMLATGHILAIDDIMPVSVDA
ncbi:MAG: DMT family transporter, partial [Proteobacteria bacterium]|nr:DMT family transporter [Pseudomonadota bacterium]